MRRVDQVKLFRLREVVNDDLRAVRLERFFDELDVQRMDLIVVLRLLVREHEVQRDLIGLIDHGPVAANHLAHVKAEHAGDGLEVLFATRDEIGGGVGFVRMGPEDDNVTETGDNLWYIRFHT